MNRQELYELSCLISERDDESSFKAVYDDLYFDLVAFSKSMVLLQQDAEDIVVDVFVRLWENRKNMSNIKNLSAYLYTATKYASLNCLKARSTRNNIDIDKLEDHFVYAYTSPENQLISKETVQQIESAIALLPPKTKLVFYMIKEKRLSCMEIAQILNISVRTVETQVYHAVRKIAALLQKAEDLSSEIPRLKRKV
ncbi:RNA polymerase sigma-70 factor [Niabella terrae]